MFKKILIVITMFFTISYSSGISNNYDLVFIIDSSCLTCQKLDSVVQNLKKQYGFKVYEFSPNGKGMYEGEDVGYLSKRMQDYLGIEKVYYPMLILYDKHSRGISYDVLAKGYVDYSIVTKRLKKALNKKAYTKSEKQGGRKRITVSIPSIKDGEFGMFEDFQSINKLVSLN